MSQVNQKDAAAYLALVTYAFHKTPTGGAEAFYQLLRQSSVHAHHDNDQLTSLVVDTHFQVNFSGQAVAMSGIGYVASYPEYRGNGAASRLLTEILQENYAKGTIFSYLAPFSYQFYRQFGYDYVFNQKRYEIEAADFPRGQKTDLTVRRLPFDIAQADLARVHQQADNHGSLVRGTFEWTYYFTLKKQPQFALVYDGEVAKGYVIYDFVGMDFIIYELLVLDEVAKQALYRFIASHGGAFERFLYTAPDNTGLERDMLEPSRANVTLLPYMMARLVNVSEFLKRFPIHLDKRITVVDEVLPANNLTFGEGEAVTMSIAELTKEVLQGAILREYF
ncbi:MAG: GNAT family N-acetyltransferase [Streptococcaceae bacterium]|jgi:predicted acetyltransferase|nr:GNAT family N-acetyltransferase [Streptococcaceae bacterium]